MASGAYSQTDIAGGFLICAKLNELQDYTQTLKGSQPPTCSLRYLFENPDCTLEWIFPPMAWKLSSLPGS